jgi:hypothetical protein
MLTKLIFIAVAALTLSPSAGHSQTDSSTPLPLSLVTTFEVDASAPFFSKAKLWIMLGQAPDQFTLYEFAYPDSAAKNFSLALLDDGGTKWLEINSDTNTPSTVKLPDDTTKALGANGIAFIKALRQMFTDSAAHYITGQVTLGNDSAMYASAVELESKFTNIRRFLVRTYDDQNTYIEGEVLIEYADCVVAYHQIDVRVTQSKVMLKLTPVGAVKGTNNRK